MFTCCPSCQTVFRVYAETLRVAQGQVRCGRCSTQFNALDSLADAPEALIMPAEDAVEDAAPIEPGEVPAETPFVETPLEQMGTKAAAPGPEIPGESAPQSLGEQAGVQTGEPPEAPPGEPQTEGVSGDTAVVPEVPELSAQMVAGVASPGVEAQTVPPPVALAPEIIQEALLTEEPSRRPPGSRLAGGLAIVLLLILLGGQWLYLQRAPLYERVAWRPALQRFCAVLGCDLPLPRLPERIEVIERVVREHPRVARALLVDLSFVSRADQVIAYPVLELRLTDVSGNRVAGRRFAPQEYLPPDVDIRAGVRPGQPVQVTLEVVAPQFEAASFQFEFL